jgi:hypothetical protein
MGSEAQAQRLPFIEMPKECLEIAQPAIKYESTADIAHSEENILRWMAYLPEDCIRTMVLMGWDITT